MLKRFILFAGITILVLVAGYFILSINSVKFLQSKMQENLGPGFSFSHFNATTRYVAGKGITIEEPESKLKLLEIDEVRIYPAIRSLFSRNIIIKNIVLYNPSAFVYRTKDSVIIGPGLSKTTENQKLQKENKQFFNITIDNITIHNGSLLFTDRKGLSPPAIIHLIEIESNVQNIKFPLVEEKSPVALKGKLSDEDKGDVNVIGWFNIKNGDTHLDVSLTSADFTKFKPYYKESVANIVEKGLATVISKIDIQKSIAEISGKLYLSNLYIDESKETHLEITSKDISDMVKSKNRKINAAFYAKGNLNDPKFNPYEDLVNSIVSDLSKSTKKYFKKQAIDTLKKNLKNEKEKIKEKIKDLF